MTGVLNYINAGFAELTTAQWVAFVLLPACLIVAAPTANWLFLRAHQTSKTESSETEQGDGKPVKDGPLMAADIAGGRGSDQVVFGAARDFKQAEPASLADTWLSSQSAQQAEATHMVSAEAKAAELFRKVTEMSREIERLKSQVSGIAQTATVRSRT